MKTHGYALREAIKRRTKRRDDLSKLFPDSFKAFPDEEKPSPDVLMKQIASAELAIARLQTAAMRYNLAVPVKVPGLPALTNLAEAVKAVGGIQRAEKMWRDASVPASRSPWSDEERDETKLRATVVMRPSQALENAETTGRVSAALRQAIALANATEIEVPGLDDTLFE